MCRQWSAQPFCAGCTSRYGAWRARCPRCAVPTPCGDRCGACGSRPGPVARTITAFDYAFPWDRAVQQLKYHDRTDLARPLARALARAVHVAGNTAGTAGATPHGLVPIPLAPARLAQRGYNQSLLLARQLSRVLRIPVDATVLQRPLDTAHQPGLGREQRGANLRGAFWVDSRQRQRVAGRDLILVDDVLTTGATTAEAARELLRAGARSVAAWVVARAA